MGQSVDRIRLFGFSSRNRRTCGVEQNLDGRLWKGIAVPDGSGRAAAGQFEQRGAFVGFRFERRGRIEPADASESSGVEKIRRKQYSRGSSASDDRGFAGADLLVAPVPGGGSGESCRRDGLYVRGSSRWA